MVHLSYKYILLVFKAPDKMVNKDRLNHKSGYELFWSEWY